MNLFGFLMHGGEEGVDLAPLVDIAFLLLTFFIMTATFSSQIELKPDNPKSSSMEREPDSRYITVILGDSAKTGDKVLVYMDNAAVREAAMEGKLTSKAEALKLTGFEIKKDNLKKDLFEILYRARQKDPAQTIVLNADKNCKYGLINDVMVIMRQVKFDKVRVVTMMES